jgi:hypothetical protein
MMVGWEIWQWINRLLEASNSEQEVAVVISPVICGNNYGKK